MQHVNEAEQAFTELVYDSVVVQLFKVFPKLWCVRAVWDGLNEEFYEKITKQYIRDEDIITWWEDNKNE